MTDATATEIDRLIGEIAFVNAPEAVIGALRAVARHRFIPALGLAAPLDAPPYLIDRDAAPEDWRKAVYSDVSIVTQLDDGATDLGGNLAGNLGETDYTSSASAPSAVADLLTLLDPLPGHRVLEVGTGTGWTAALLSHLLGETRVTSIEVDASVARTAAKNLGDAGFQPHLIVGDGADGCAERVPFDRVHVTCGIRRVPYAWVEQCRPGAVIAAPWCPGFGTDHALRLVVTRDGTAHGRFPRFASYMIMRSQRPLADQPARDDADKHHLTTTIDPRTIAWAPPGADLAIAATTGLTSNTAGDTDEAGDLHRLWVSDPTAPHSWAAAVWRPHTDEYQVYQVGDRPVWEETVEAYFRWISLGEPDRERFGMTITPEAQHIWLDHPDHVISPERP
ncbi:methyltransferase domain-containing protein [Spongiactinospora sp. TRM90649]|uniref:methyltransferase domain-containing protein n=1 Tax=Spongiactinospora sp. TRM90649 TaxID=3031114 RepID=UPI0023F99758|nr:methyltransferase domain-containing protein [Spongiactinospora sp. TRM90649]MDF5751388.1 methyltransferase domain-containing protein [Spongiactinospora sp. TRM90649]